MRRHSAELLAPGGSLESIRAAVNAGADAVYAGGNAFGARAYALNLSTDDMREAIDYCHLRGAKLYLTVNTLLKEKELNRELYEFILPLYEHGVDAVLVQDFGVFHFLREHFPDLPLHASTQMTVTGADGVKLLARMGAERVVLSRELSLDEIRSIRKECDVELETFVHGALCYCYSGQCMMSSLIGGRSGNRGRCAQPCRLPYELYETPADVKARRMKNRDFEQYLLSPKDICTLRILPDLIDAGIASLKIEGRMKSPEYAAGVTSVYRKYMDLCERSGRACYEVDPKDEQLLSDLFSRGDTSEGYYNTHNGRSMITLSEKEDRGPQTRRAQEAVKRVHDAYVDVRTSIPVSACVTIKKGIGMKMSLTGPGGAYVCVEGAVPSDAQSRPADEESVRKQVKKAGNTDFVYESIEIDLDDGLFLQVKDLNELRRRALDAMHEALLAPGRRKASAGTDRMPETQDEAGRPESETASEKGADTAGKPDEAAEKGFSLNHPKCTASVFTQEQLDAVLDSPLVGGVYLDHAVCTALNAQKVRSAGKKAYLMLPPIWRENAAKVIRGEMEDAFGSFGPGMKEALDGILVGSFDQIEALSSAGIHASEGFELIADASVYTWNSEARKVLCLLGITMDTIPHECSVHELEERGCRGSEFVIYGRQTLMASAQCVTKITTGCRHERSVRYLRDRKGILFPVVTDCAICMNRIFNSVPLELVSLSGQVKKLCPASMRYAFTIESAEEVKRILKGKLPDTVTRGHFRKGVE